jgi:hypothetical protein
VLCAVCCAVSACCAVCCVLCFTLYKRTGGKNVKIRPLPTMQRKNADEITFDL